MKKSGCLRADGCCPRASCTTHGTGGDRDAGGQPVYGGGININGRDYTAPSGPGAALGGGDIGYLHIRAMNAPSLRRFFEEQAAYARADDLGRRIEAAEIRRMARELAAAQYGDRLAARRASDRRP